MIIPRPLEHRTQSGAFAFARDLTLRLDYHTDLGYAYFVAEDLAQLLRVATGGFATVRADDSASADASVVLLTDRDCPPDLGAEGYVLEVTPQRIVLRAPTNAGLFYAAQSLIQVLDHARAQADGGPLKQLSCFTVRDKPRFAWRGFMLDSARHVQPIGFVYQIINQMAALKLNRFHWHLSDDQGWRVEVLGYPRLTSVGAWRQNGQGRYGGFYTQEQVRGLVEYAHQRNITVIPEIDIPGHSLAALAAYPELGCRGQGYSVRGDWGIMSGTFCAGIDKTYAFLENVYGELAEVFSGPYLHLGGDERKPGVWDGCPKCSAVRQQHGLPDEAALQKWFMDRVARRVHESLCRRSIAWGDNIDAGGIEGQIVQGWIPGQAVKAAEQGLDVINSTNVWLYLDYPESQEAIGTTRPTWMKALPLEKVHAFDPIPEGLRPELHKHVLGSETHLWTEYVPDEAQVRKQIIPRLHAFSEAIWTASDGRDFADFKKRLKTQRAYLD